MSRIDEYFTSNNIDINSIVTDLMICINPAYMIPPKMQTKNYKIPARTIEEDGTTPYEYVRIPLEDKIVTNILNVVTLKSRYADVDKFIIAEETIDEIDEDLVGLALHGKYLVLNNTEEDTVIQIQYSDIPNDYKSLDDDMFRYLKMCYYYALTSDYQNMYEALGLLSNAKSNSVSKNIHTEKDRRSNQVFKIGLFKI